MTTPGDKVTLDDTRLSRTAASQAVEALGWRYLLGTLRVVVSVGSLMAGVTVARTSAAACGERAEAHLHVDVRGDRVELSLQDRAGGVVTGVDAALAARVTAALRGVGVDTARGPEAVGRSGTQMLEIAIDAIDIPAIRLFWKAVTAYDDEPGAGPSGALVDPAGRGPAIWFQQMGAPRPQRNRIHLDITVAHDDAEARLRAALAAGGRLLEDAFARSFWVLADAEGNEACICTWLDRDEREWRD